MAMYTEVVYIVLGAILVSVVAVLIGRSTSRRIFLKGRVRIAPNQVVTTLPPSVDVSLALELIAVIAKAYRIDPGLLRLDDLLTDLGKLDSWDLGSGQDRLETWLRARGISSPLDTVSTVRDLVIRIASKT
jgi:hypothetical protein